MLPMPILDFLISTKFPILTFFPIIASGLKWVNGPTVTLFSIVQLFKNELKPSIRSAASRAASSSSAARSAGRADCLIFDAHVVHGSSGNHSTEMPRRAFSTRWAGEGVRFDSAYAPSATTAPTHASIWTATYPVAHSVVKNGMTLDETHRTLAEIARDNGYRTAAFVSSYVLDARFGFAQGFDTYDDDFEAGESTVELERWADEPFEAAFDRRADRTTDAALDWLADAATPGAAPFFLFVHYFDPHSPYVPPPEFAARFKGAEDGASETELEEEIRRYDGEIAFADAALGRLLEGLAAAGLDRQTVVVVTADHGEGLGQHGLLLHGLNVYEEAVRVPLLLRWPGVLAPGARIAAPVGLVDLAPTLLDLLGVANGSAGFAGESVARALRGEAELGPERPILLVRRHYEPGIIDGVRVNGVQLAVRQGRWKYIEGAAFRVRELYDLERDPGERVNRFREEPGVARRLAALLAPLRRSKRVPRLDEDTRRGLEALGYVE